MKKCLIIVEGGCIQSIHTSEQIKVVIVDHDLADIGECPVSVVKPDSITNSFRNLFSAVDPKEKEILDELKRQHVE